MPLWERSVVAPDKRGSGPTQLNIMPSSHLSRIQTILASSRTEPEYRVHHVVPKSHGAAATGRMRPEAPPPWRGSATPASGCHWPAKPDRVVRSCPTASSGRGRGTWRPRSPTIPVHWEKCLKFAPASSGLPALTERNKYLDPWKWLSARHPVPRRSPD